ncbi:hypothetical protein [Pediococcus pentosaceus]|uniref:hypothetical protein n=1 Tax=Pediococcus pentosaceus TaxID=1255 RepID=UPI0039828DE2
MTLESYMEKKKEYAIKQIADVHFQAIRGEDPTVVEMALQDIREAASLAILNVKPMEGRK